MSPSPESVPLVGARTKTRTRLAMTLAVGALLGVFGLGFVGIVVESTRAHLEAANVRSTLLDVVALSDATKMYAIEHGGRFPTTLDKVLPYLVIDPEKNPLIDVWGTPFEYELPREGELAPHVFSLGNDGAWGGVGFAADIDSFEAERLFAAEERQ